MAEPQMVDPHDVVMTGENSFIRLSHDGGKTLSDRVNLSYLRHLKVNTV